MKRSGLVRNKISPAEYTCSDAGGTYLGTHALGENNGIESDSLGLKVNMMRWADMRGFNTKIILSLFSEAIQFIWAPTSHQLPVDQNFCLFMTYEGLEGDVLQS